MYAPAVSEAVPASREDQLIHLLVDDVLARPIGELVAPRAAAESFRRLLVAVCASDAAIVRLVAPLVAHAEALREDKARVRDLLPPEVQATLHDLAEYEFTPLPWPEFSAQSLAECIDAFHMRRRRFGQVDADPAQAI